MQGAIVCVVSVVNGSIRKQTPPFLDEIATPGCVAHHVVTRHNLVVEKPKAEDQILNMTAKKVFEKMIFWIHNGHITVKNKKPVDVLMQRQDAVHNAELAVVKASRLASRATLWNLVRYLHRKQSVVLQRSVAFESLIVEGVFLCMDRVVNNNDANIDRWRGYS